VRRVGHEIASDRLQPAQLGDVHEDGHYASRWLLQRNCAHQHPPRAQPGQIQLDLGRRARRRHFQYRMQFCIAYDLEHWLSDRILPDEEHLAQSRVREDDVVLLIDDEHAFVHARQNPG
jgi:hypothetical protein